MSIINLQKYKLIYYNRHFFPQNMGAWTFVQPRFLSFLKQQRRGIVYAGRAPSASPATGNKYTHSRETKEVMDAILKKEYAGEQWFDVYFLIRQEQIIWDTFKSVKAPKLGYINCVCESRENQNPDV